MVKSPIKHDKHGEIPIELPSSVLGPPRPKEGPWFACAEDRWPPGAWGLQIAGVQSLSLKLAHHSSGLTTDVIIYNIYNII
jgi:hypothetical protein